MADAARLVELLEKIRADSAEARLSPESELAALLPDGQDIEAILGEATDDDIRSMRGPVERYYYSERFMTETYARHLCRLAGRDPARLLADTVRDESRIYPRPTPVAAFIDAPFSMTQAEIDHAVSRLSALPEFDDIGSITCSNGELYLYSRRYLAEAHASGLAEWAAVGMKENP